MDFEDRFCILRGYKTNNKKIKSLSPKLLETTNILKREKLDFRYFLIDFEINEPIGKFQYLKSKNTTSELNDNKLSVDSFIDYEAVVNEENTSTIPPKYYEFNKIKRLFLYKREWIIITYEDDSFIINSSMFIDYLERFSRVSKIKRIIK